MEEDIIIPAPAPEETINKQSFFKEYRSLLIIAGLIITVAIVFIISSTTSTKQIVIGQPNQTITVKAGETYTITWGAKGVTSIGIVLFDGSKGSNAQWIAKGIAATKGKYDWVVAENQQSGSDYRLAVFEYPWKKGNAIAYTTAAIQIIGPQYISCNDLAVQSEWPYLPGNYPGLKRAFITRGNWTGNLGGIEGADAKCQQEADSRKLDGKFIAFLGTDTVSAKERIQGTAIFASVDNSMVMPDGQTCYRLLGRDVDSLLNKFLLSANQVSITLESEFAKSMNGVWIGRRTPTAPSVCLQLSGMGAAAAFSGTHTCQNWVKSDGQVYQGTIPPDADLPRCYDKQGNSAFANYVAANAIGFSTDNSLVVSGTPCNRYNRLFCVEQ